MPIPAADLEWMIRESGGVHVEFGGAVTWGHLNSISAEVLAEPFGGGVTGVTHSLVIPTAAMEPGSPFASLKIDSQLRINRGSLYKVRSAPAGIEDGQLTQMFLREV